MLKRYVFFAFENNYDFGDIPAGGQNDVKFEADTLEELATLVSLRKLRDWDDYHWLDLDERRWSTVEEEKAFMARLVDLEPKQEPETYILPHTKEWADFFGSLPEPSGRVLYEAGLFGYQHRWFGTALNRPMILSMPGNFKPEPDLRTEDQKRADYLRSCHIKYTK